MDETDAAIDCALDAVIRFYLRTEVTEPILKVIGGKLAELAEDRLLTATQAAEILNVSDRWLYRYAPILPYAVRLGNNVIRFSRNQIQKEIARKIKIQGQKQ